ncbi:MAG: LUD domain-containing protein, partial [Granulicella sp.]
MPPTLSARDEILSLIRTALPGTPTSVEASHASIVRNYNRIGRLDRHACLELFVEYLVDYDTEVIQLEESTGDTLIAQSVADILRNAHEERLIVDEAFPDHWLPSSSENGLTILRDNGFTTEQIDVAQTVLTTCEAATAATGTIFLVHGGAQGRRATTLLPDHHICIVRRDQVYELIPETLAV